MKCNEVINKENFRIFRYIMLAKKIEPCFTKVRYAFCLLTYKFLSEGFFGYFSRSVGLHSALRVEWYNWLSVCVLVQLSCNLRGARFYFLLTRSIVYNVHHDTKENFNEACIVTRHSRVKENSFCLAC